VNLRILYDHQIFSLQPYGGVSRYFVELIKHLSQLPGAHTSVFMGRHINKYDLAAYQERFANFNASATTRSLIPRYLRLILNTLLFNWFYTRVNPDIYHQTYYFTLSPPASAKPIITIFDMVYELYPQSFPPYDFTSILKRRSVHNAAGVICVSHTTKADLVRLFGISPDNVAVTYLANSLYSTASTRPPIDGPYLLYVGRRPTFLRTEYKVVCFSGEPFTRRERHAIRQRGLANKILRCSGTDDILATLYRYAAAFVYPSLYEGFGLPALEAMHYGCPVVASDTPALAEVVGPAGLFFDPHDPDDLISKLERILRDQTLRTRLLATGYDRERSFSWDTCARDTVAFYHRIMNR